MPYFHSPVLLSEVLEYLRPQAGENFIDCTVGGGGHALEIFKRIQPGGKLLAIDLDCKAIEATRKRVAHLSQTQQKNFILVHNNFANLKDIVYDYKFFPINGILLDLGISSDQLAREDRGFSFNSQEILDMRFSGTGDTKLLTANSILKNYPQEKLEDIFRSYADERLARPIAKRIVEIRQKKEYFTANDVSKLVSSIYKKYFKERSRKHPATKVFQALRMEVNNELENLKRVLPQALELAELGGRIAVISFHSVEDRVVKKFFRLEASSCICPREIPVCQCDRKPTVKIVNKKVITPSNEEQKKNPRARSAKLRVVEKILS